MAEEPRVEETKRRSSEPSVTAGEPAGSGNPAEQLTAGADQVNQQQSASEQSTGAASGSNTEASVASNNEEPDENAPPNNNGGNESDDGSDKSSNHDDEEDETPEAMPDQVDQQALIKRAKNSLKGYKAVLTKTVNLVTEALDETVKPQPSEEMRKLISSGWTNSCQGAMRT